MTSKKPQWKFQATMVPVGRTPSEICTVVGALLAPSKCSVNACLMNETCPRELSKEPTSQFRVKPVPCIVQCFA